MKIACFHLNQIGDLMFSLPALKCLRDGFPGAHITSVVRPSTRAMMGCTGLADEVMVRDSGLNLGKLSLAGRLAAGKFDLAIVFSQSAECALLARMTRAPRRIGFINTSFGWLLTEQVTFTHPPSTENNLRLVESAGCPVTKRDYVGLLKPSADMMDWANIVLTAHSAGVLRPIIAIASETSGRRRLKEWTDSGFAHLARHFTAQGFKVILLGTAPATNIVQECPEILDLGGKTTLSDVVGLLARCEALVAVDSGILHLCAALAKPVVGLYGPSNLAVTGPQGEGHIIVTSGAECSPCDQIECNFNRKCMTNIDPRDVIAAVDAVLGKSRAGKQS